MSQLIIGLGHKARNGKDSFASAVETYYSGLHATAINHGMRSYRPVVVQRHAFADALYQEVNKWLTTSEGKRFRGLGGILLNGHYTVEEGDLHDTFSPNGLIFTGVAGKKPVILPDWVEPDEKPEISSRAPYGKHPKLLQWWGTEYRRAQDLNYWVKKWKEGINPKADIVLATDMRFFNEGDAVYSVGGFRVQVSRLNQDGTQFTDPDRDANHISETQLDGYNYDHRIIVKTGDIRLLEEYAITLVHYLRAMKGQK
jgi:hypothetical protein